jgi:aspartyl protease family protein
MIAQTVKIVSALALVALLSVATLQNHWLDRGIDAASALVAPHAAIATTTPAQPTPPLAAAPPPRSSSHSGMGVVELLPDRNAQFRTEVEIDGTRIHALVDTGASQVLLSAEDARAINIDPPASAYTATAQTANGAVNFAPVRLRELRVGGITVYDVDGLVARPGQTAVSLLGMSFLRKLSSFQVADGHFVMKQ